MRHITTLEMKADPYGKNGGKIHLTRLSGDSILFVVETVGSTAIGADGRTTSFEVSESQLLAAFCS